MHEISLVRTIFTTLEAEFPAETLATISDIKLKVGKLSNVEPVLMQNAFEAVTQTENRFTNAKLSIEVIPIVIECPNCGHHTEIDNYTFICERCQTPTNNLISGTELLISGVEFAD